MKEVARGYVLPLGIAAPSYYNSGVLPQIDYSSLLGCLTRERLVEVGRSLGVSLPLSARKERQIEAFLGSAPPRLAPLVGLLQRDELKVICRQHGLPDGGRARLELARRVLVAAGESDLAPAPVFATEAGSRELPRPGDVVRMRHRQYLVESVTPPARPRRPGGPMAAHRVRLVDLDDESQGRLLEVLWELEQGARIPPRLRKNDGGAGQALRQGRCTFSPAHGDLLVPEDLTIWVRNFAGDTLGASLSAEVPISNVVNPLRVAENIAYTLG